MITADEFLEWCAVFHVATGGNPPTTVSLQVAYNNSSPKQIDISSGNLNFINGSFGLNVSAFNLNASFQVDSTTQGTIPAPRMTNAQLEALYTTLGTSDNALMVYDTDHQTYNYWEGVEKKEVLAIQNMIAGANMNVIDNNDGTVTLAATSGPSAVNSGQATYYIASNAMNTVFGGVGAPVPILSDNANVLYQNNFSVTLVADSPTAQFLTAAIRQCLINACFTLRTASVLSQTFSLYINIDHGGSSTTTSKLASITMDPSGAPGPQIISTTLNLALTGPNDKVQFYLSNDSATTDPVLVIDGTVTILDTTQFGAFSSTDVLPQGANNLYLSQDGGTTFENVSSLPVTVGNVATFSTVGGEIQDSGETLSGVIRQGDSDIYFGAPPTSPFVSAKMLNLYAVGTAGANAQNWYNGTDNYPLFQVSPLNHDSLDLNFDCYYDGSFLRASTGGISWQINKSSGHLVFQYGGAAQGNILSMTAGMDIDGAGRVTLPSGGSVETLRLGTSSSSLSLMTPALLFNSNYGAGNYINFGGSGRNIGTQSGLMFASYNANYNSSLSNYQIVASGNVFVQEWTSTGVYFKYQISGTGGTGASLSTSMAVTNSGTVQLPYLSSGSSLISVDSSKNIEVATGFFTLSGMTFNNGNAALANTTAVLNFASVLSDGDYINLAGTGRNIGVTNAGTVFHSYNLDWDGGAATYKFNTVGGAFVVEIGATGIFFKSSTGGSAGSPVVPAIGLQMDSSGVLDIPFVTNNSLMARVGGQITTAIGGSFQMAQLLLNSVTAPSLTQAGRLNLVGQNTTTDNALNLYVHTDGYPLVNIVGTAHGTQYANFDCYFDGTNPKSSNSGSNFRFNKSSNLFKLEAATGFAQGATITFTSSWTVDTAGKFYVNGVSASSFVTTDGAGAFNSTANIFITTEATITGSTQSAASNTRYYVNYSGGQCVITLPAATSGGGPIEIIGLSTASTSGWKAVAIGSDVIQFGSSVSAAAGNIVSTVGSATDAITLRPISGKWIVYPALGLNLTVT